MKIKFSKKYEPLFKLLDDDNYREVDTVIMTGGRSSAKSFCASVVSMVGLVEKGWNVLYTRFTNVSIIDSIKPEVDDKIELLNYQNKVISTNTHIEYKGNRIAFKGIKTGSKQQTANLKSLSGFNVFIVDEAEEIPDYETFEKVFLSIRSKDKRNLTILLLNPTATYHWIYKRFFKRRLVEAGSNVVKNNIMYIHTSYLDVPKEYIAKNILGYYREMEKNEPERYNSIVLGGWTDNSERAVYKNWQVLDVDFDSLPYPSYYGLDFGSSKPSALVEIKYDGNRTIFLKEIFYLPRNENESTLGEIFTKLKVKKNIPMSCDYAEPDSITRLQEYGFLSIGCPTKEVKAHIEDIQKLKVYVTEDSTNIWNEYECYEWEFVNGENLDRPKKKDDHILDAIRYGVAYIKREIGLNY